jgi:putative phage-type endonuclease
MKMKKINLEQGSQVWLDYRKNRIGASDSAIILGLSPYKTRMGLWNEKMGILSFDETPAMSFGKNNEELIRNIMSDKLKGNFKPSCFEHEESPWLMCSVDGFDEDTETLIEIKCANKADHDLACRKVVPTKYMPQLQTIMCICDLFSIWYCSYHKGDLQYFLVRIDYEFIEDMLPKLKDFWDSLQNFQKPEINEEHKEFIKEEVKYIENEEDEWKNLSLCWDGHLQRKKDWDEEDKTLRQRIMSTCQEQNMKGCGMKVTKRERKGSILYSNVPALQGVDLDKYRGDKTIYWVIEND